jgi:hypothetical protein
MLDPFTSLLIDDWENEEIEDERHTLIRQIIDDWENAIAFDPLVRSDSFVNGIHVAYYSGFREMPERGITLRGVMEYTPYVPFPDSNRMALAKKINERLREFSVSDNSVMAEIKKAH